MLSLFILMSLASGTDALPKDSLDWQLYKTGQELGHDFIRVGLYLGLEMSDLDNIKSSDQHGSQNWGHQMLTIWKRKQMGDEDAIKEHLCNALQDEHVQRLDLAKHFCEQELNVMDSNDKTSGQSQSKCVEWNYCQVIILEVIIGFLLLIIIIMGIIMCILGTGYGKMCRNSSKRQRDQESSIGNASAARDKKSKIPVPSASKKSRISNASPQPEKSIILNTWLRNPNKSNVPSTPKDVYIDIPQVHKGFPI